MLAAAICITSLLPVDVMPADIVIVPAPGLNETIVAEVAMPVPVMSLPATTPAKLTTFDRTALPATLSALVPNSPIRSIPNPPTAPS